MRLSNVAISLQNCSNMFFHETVERELIPKDKYQIKIIYQKLRIIFWTWNYGIREC